MKAPRVPSKGFEVFASEILWSIVYPKLQKTLQARTPLSMKHLHTRFQADHGVKIPLQSFLKWASYFEGAAPPAPARAPQETRTPTIVNGRSKDGFDNELLMDGRPLIGVQTKPGVFAAPFGVVGGHYTGQ